MKVKELMSKNISFVSPDTPIVEVAKAMKNNNIGSVPVCEGDKVIGIITDRDIVLRDVALGKSIENVKAKDVMTVGLSTVTPEADIHEAANLMADKQIRRLPVVDNGRLVGMIAIGDMAVKTKFENEAGEALSDISKPAHTAF
jgi:CBS domain-containing protein